MELKLKELDEPEVEEVAVDLELELDPHELGLASGTYLWCVQSRARDCSRCPVRPGGRHPLEALRPWTGPLVAVCGPSQI